MEAFEVLYERHRGPLYRYILRLVGNPATANDLYQGSWEKIIKARGRYKDSAPFKAWMYRIAHNHVMDHFRREQPRRDRLNGFQRKIASSILLRPLKNCRPSKKTR